MNSVEQVKLFIYWKDGISFTCRSPNFDRQRKKNEIVYKIVSSKFGTFPKNITEFNEIKNDLINELLGYNDIIVVFQFIIEDKVEIICKLPDPNFELYVAVISNVFDKDRFVNVVTDKVGERVEQERKCN